MLKSDLDHAIRLAGCIAAALSLFDGLGYGFFTKEVFARGDRIQKMSPVDMKRRSDDHRIDVLQVQQPSMVSESLHGGGELFRFSMSPVVDIGNGDELDIPELQRIAHVFLPTTAEANGAEAHAVVGSEHAVRRARQPHSGASQCCLFHELPSL